MQKEASTMETSTTQLPSAAGRNDDPPDIEAMRRTARGLLGPDDAPDFLPPGEAELEVVTGQLVGYLAVLMPQVETLATARHKSVEQYCALGCVGEGRRKLSVTPDPDLRSRALHARRLARVLDALCKHYEHLGGEAPRP
jgi:hypothetical protein